jgi:hypothetical protein
MPRRPSPDAKTQVVSARITADEAVLMDEIRGATDASVWVENLIRAELQRHAAASRQTAPGDCPHPKGRVIKGFCYRCGHPANL